MVDLPKRPSTEADVAEAQEIRAFIRQQKSPIDFVMKNLSDRSVLSAVLTARPFLCNLTEAEHNVVRTRARTALHPVQAEMQAKLRKALGELTEGVAAARLVVLERTEMRIDNDGEFRSIHESPPRGRQSTAPKVGTEQPAPS